MPLAGACVEYTIRQSILDHVVCGYERAIYSVNRSNRRERRLKFRILTVLVLTLSTTLACNAQADWQRKVQNEMPMLGHRNWIVVVDSAYPLQNSAGIETVTTGADQLAVLEYVLNTIKGSKHVRPLAHLDKELQFVQESDAPGIEQYRKDLKLRLANIDTDSILHDQLIARLKETSESFHVLVLKTTMTIPYTSVFLQLDCRYWTAEQEKKLRQDMDKVRPNQQ
jgi:hypothetical protein